MNWLKKALVSLASPWTANAAFFVSMQLLGCVVAWMTLPHVRGARLYEGLYAELFFDVSVLCVLLRLLPGGLRLWVRRALYVLLYGVSLVDVYCFVRYDTTLTPTVLMLIGETNADEAGEFLQTVFSGDVLAGRVGVLLLMMAVHTASAVLWSRVLRRRVGMLRPTALGSALADAARGCLGVALVATTVWAGFEVWGNKQGVWRLMTARTIGVVEHLLTEKNHGVMYHPAYRLAFSVRANVLTAGQVSRLREVCAAARVDSCAHTVPEIVVVIGESFSRHHSQQYGYWQPTTPVQVALEQTGRLVRFTDVVSPWNLTSFVMKLMFSTYTVGDEGEWCDYPLFPCLFRAAGYRVTFLTNQFLPRAKEAVYDFSGGFFVNDAQLSGMQFDARNTKKFRFDESLIDEWRRLRDDSSRLNLTMFQLIGQHVLYRQRSPGDRRAFRADDYLKAKPHLTAGERRILADYDNATLYNDSVLGAIVRLFDDKDAIIVHVPDHGEECYEGDLHFYCRMHSAEITARLAHAEFDIPFWIYCTPRCIAQHPDIYNAVNQAAGKPFMTDALPHLLLGLAGIHSPHYDARRDPLNGAYDARRRRILKNTTDYDRL